MNSRLKKVVSKAAIGAVMLCMALFIYFEKASGDVKFKNFEESGKSRLETEMKKSEEAEVTAKEWLERVSGVMEELRASWEKEAAKEIERNGGNGEGEREEAREEWEKEAEKEIARGYGRYSAKIEKESLTDEERKEIEAAVRKAGEAGNLSEWESVMASSGVREALNADWEKKLEEKIEKKRAEGAKLNGAARDAFEKELEKEIEERKREKSRELERIVSGGKNRYIIEKSEDYSSLRYESDKEEAGKIVERVLKETEEDLVEEEDKIFNREIEGEKGTEVFASDAREYLEKGYRKWADAQSDLYGRMLEWIENAKLSYEEGNAKWAEAYNRLIGERAKWEEKVNGEIKRKLAEWEKKGEDLEDNIERTREDLERYNETLRTGWTEHASGLQEAMLAGSAGYAEALENIEWYGNMEAATKEKVVYGGRVVAYGGNLENVLKDDAILRYLCNQSESLKTGLSQMINNIPPRASHSDTTSSYGSGGGSTKTITSTYNHKLVIDSIVPVVVKEENKYGGVTIKLEFKINAYYVYDCKVSTNYTNVQGSFYPRDSSYSESGKGKAVLKTVVTGQNQNGQAITSSSIEIVPVSGLVKNETIVLTEKVLDTSNGLPKEFASFYLYAKEKFRWEKIKKEYAGVVEKAEKIAHDADMRGENGVGYLDNGRKDGDPYLMTSLEMSEELAKRENDYWKKRLDIAEAVLEYANGLRGSAADTAQAKEKAEEEMKAKEEAYEVTLEKISGLTLELERLKGKKPAGEESDIDADWIEYKESLEYLTEKMSEAKAKLDKARKEYLIANEALILKENGGFAELKRQIDGYREQIASSGDEYEKKKVLLAAKAKEVERARGLKRYFEDYEKIADKYESVKYEEEKGKILSCFDDGKIDLSKVKEKFAGEEALVKEAERIALLFGSARDEAESALAEGMYSRLYALKAMADGAKSLLESYTKEGFNVKDETEKLEEESAEEKENMDYALSALEAVEKIEGVIEELDEGWGYAELLAGVKEEFGKVTFDKSDLEGNGEYYAWKAAYEYVKGMNEPDGEKIEKYLGIEKDTLELLSGEVFAGKVEEERLDEYYANIAGEESGIYEEVLRGYHDAAQLGGMFALVREVNSQIGSVYKAKREYLAGMKDDYESFAVNLESEDDVIGEIRALAGGINGELSGLNGGDLSQLAKSVKEYITREEKEGRKISDFVREACEKIINASREYEAYKYIVSEGLGDATKVSEERKSEVKKEYEAAKERDELLRKVYGFMSRVTDMLKGDVEEEETVELSNLAADYLSLGEEGKEVLRGYDGDFEEVMEGLIERDRRRRFNEETGRYLTELEAGTAEERSGYMETLVLEGRISEEERGSFEKFVSDAEEKLRLSELEADELPGLLEKYIEDKGVSRDWAYLEAYRKIGVKIERAGIDALDESAYPAEFREYLKSLKAGEAGYMDKLPEEVKGYLAADNYYEGYYSKGIFVSAADYLTELGKSFTVSEELKGRVEEYIGTIAKSLKYYGESISEFFERNGVTGEAEKERLMKHLLNAGSGIDVFAAENFYLTGEVKEEIERMVEYEKSAGLIYSNTLEAMTLEMYQKIEGDLDESAEEVYLKKTADDYLTNAGSHVSWRNYILAKPYEKIVKAEKMTDDEYKEAIDPKNMEEQKTTEITKKVYGISDIENGRYFEDTILKISETGTKEERRTICATGESAEGGMALAKMLDSLSGIYVELEALESYGDEYKGKNDIWEYFDGKKLSELTKEERTTLERQVELYVSESEALYDSNTEGEMLTAETGLKSGREEVCNKGKVLEVLGKNGAATKAVIQKELNEKSNLLTEAEADYAVWAKEAGDARERYAAKEKEYVDALGESSKAYKDMKESEFGYEKAYAVWEYAYTPYMEKDNKGIEDSGKVQNPDGGVTDTGKVSVPDAKEEYDRVKGIYDVRNAEYVKAKDAAAKEKAEGIKDAEYNEAKKWYADYTGGYVRFERAEELLNDYTAEVNAKYDEKKKEYEELKDSAYNTLATKKRRDMTEEEQRLFDGFLGQLLSDYEVRGWDVKDDETMFEGNSGWFFYWSYIAGSSFDMEKMKKNGYSSIVWKDDVYEKGGAASGLCDTREEAVDIAPEMWKKYRGIFLDYAKLLDKELLKQAEFYKMSEKYFEAVYDRNYAERKWDAVSKWNPASKRRARRAEDDAKSAERQFITLSQPLTSVFEKLSTAKAEYETWKTRYDELTNVKKLESLQTMWMNVYTVKGSGAEADKFVKMTGEGSDAVIDTTSMKKTLKVEDMDGFALSVKKNGTKLTKLTAQGKNGGEITAANMEYYEFRDADGNKIAFEDMKSGVEYALYEIVYDALDTTEFVRGVLESRVTQAKEKYYGYDTGKVDIALQLRDREATTYGLLSDCHDYLDEYKTEVVKRKTYLKAIGIKNGLAKYDAGYYGNFSGYSKVLQDLLGEGETDERIIAKVIEQNNILNEKSIEFERRTLEERRTRWIEVVSFITQRGGSEWDSAVQKFKNEWNNWSVNAKREIAKGEAEYVTALEKLNDAYVEWTKRALEAESKGLLEEMYNELDKLIAGYKESINEGLPKKLNLHIDTAGIYKEVLSKVDLTGLGSLASSMKTSMRTGLTDILNVSYTDAKKMYEKVVEDNKDAIATAKSVKQLEMLNAVREGYGKQLESANEGNYDAVVTSLIPGITESLNESGDFDGVIPIVRRGSFESSQGDKILEVRVVSSASLIGNSYKTIKVGDYINFEKELPFKKVKTPGGADIDFDDVRTFMDVEADELKSYVEYEKSYLEMEMEKTFKEDFAAHTKNELSGNGQEDPSRIGEALNEATKKYITGEAMKDAPMHRKSILPGAPDLTTLTRVAVTIAASCVGGPAGAALALAAQGAFIALDKHDGYIASWRQAGVQFGIAAATTYLTAGMGSTAASITRTAINIGTSGIDYKSNGSIGWSNDQFKAGIKSGLVNGAMSYGLDKFKVGGDGGLGAGLRAGLTNFANSTLDFNEDGFKIGIRNDNNWGDRFAAGVAGGVASAITYRASGDKESGETVGTERTEFAGGISTDEYLGHLAYNTINSGLLSAYNMKRYDMSWSNASTTTGFYSGMNYSVSELGGFAGSALVGYTKELIKKRETNKALLDMGHDTDADGNPLNKDPLGGVENFLVGMYESMCGSFSRIKNGFSGNGFNTDAELDQMEKNKQIAVAAALGEYNKSKSKDMADHILADFNKDSRDVTDAKRQAMIDADLDTTELDRELAVRRKQDAAYKAELLAQQSAGKETYGYAHATPGNMEVGPSVEFPKGNQKMISASFLDNLLGTVNAAENEGNYVKNNGEGDHLKFAGNTAYQGSMLGDMYGYNQSLIAPVLWNTAADRTAYDKAQQAEQNDFKDKYQFAMMNDNYSDKDFGQATIGVWDGINRSSFINPGNGITNRAFYEMGSAFGLDPTYDRDLIQATINGCQAGGMAPVGRALTNGLKAMINSGVTSAINAAEGMLGGSKTGLNTAFNVLKNPAVSGRIADGAFGAMTNEICYLGSTPSDQWTVGGSARSMIIGGATGMILSPYSGSSAYGKPNTGGTAFSAGFVGGASSEVINEFMAGGSGSKDLYSYVTNGMENLNIGSVLYSGFNYGVSTISSYMLASNYKQGMAPYMKTSFIGNSTRIAGSAFYGITTSITEDLYIFKKKDKNR